MHKLTFYPVGNGDTSQLVLSNGKRILFDYHHLKKTESGEGPEINLAERLREELQEVDRDYYDVVALTHGDCDHIQGSTDFFELQHAAKYQGEDRIKIKELWVPAAMILEECDLEGRGDEVIIWRSEARHRLKKGSGIRVFSKPEKLKAWLEENDLTLESRKHLITDAGQLVPGFSLAADGVEFFCHSPFIRHVDGGDVLRNAASLIFNVRLQEGTSTFDFLAVGDTDWETLEEIVSTTKAHGNEGRLVWDIYNIPHHCSYLSLSDEKGERETVPRPLIEELLMKGRFNAYIVSSSNPIKDTADGRAQVQPPHVQAKNCYEKYRRKTNGAQFLVTMERPSETKPKPIVFEIGATGIVLTGSAITGAAAAVMAPAPRAG
jgi:hypothetical protein